MKNKQLFQELASWQWEISGFQKAAFMIEERLDVIHKNDGAIPTETTKKVDHLQHKIIEEERKLDDLEKILVNQKETLRTLSNSAEWQSKIEQQQQALRKRVDTEKNVFSSLKNEYYNVLSEMLMRIAS